MEPGDNMLSAVYGRLLTMASASHMKVCKASLAGHSFPVKQRAHFSRFRFCVPNEVRPVVTAHLVHWATAAYEATKCVMYELSQPTLSLQSSCSIIFSLSRNGVVRPSGYYMELTVDRIPRLMSGLSLRVMRKLNVLFSIFHPTPSTRLGGSRS